MSESPWREIRTAIGTDARTGETIYEVREQRHLPGGYTETRRAVKRYERSALDGATSDRIEERYPSGTFNSDTLPDRED